MSKITVDEFEVCHQFMQCCVSYILPLHERKFADLTYLVSCNESIIFVSYDKKNFGGRIQQFIQAIIKEANENDLYRYHCKAHRPLVEETVTFTIL